LVFPVSFSFFTPILLATRGGRREEREENGSHSALRVIRRMDISLDTIAPYNRVYFAAAIVVFVFLSALACSM